MELQVSTANNIRTIDGNGFAIYKDNVTGQIMIKDTNGKIAQLSTLLNIITEDQDNIAKIIRVSPDHLSGEGTIPEQIAEYINSLDYEKLATDAEIWVEYDTEFVPLTEFQASTTMADGCSAPDSPPYDRTLYHNGEGAYPVLGDVVYSDSNGLIPFVAEQNNNVQMDNLEWLQTNTEGVSTFILCE